MERCLVKRNPVTPEEVAQAVDQDRFPPILTPDQAAALLQIAKPTLYKWVSQGRLDIAVRRRKPLRFWRDRLVTCVFNEN
ncbi:MAG: helix-turn-helix domain-containing protein [Phycisphaeraceae bacterium]|nr:helix-turn-helix domain-containing protein [Phycisphaeraceae bacterium]